MQSSRRRRVAGHAVAATLAAIGVSHAGWALGGRWPGSGDAELDEPYRRLGLAVYSPLCLTLAATIVHTLRRPAGRP